MAITQQKRRTRGTLGFESLEGRALLAGLTQVTQVVPPCVPTDVIRGSPAQFPTPTTFTIVQAPSPAKNMVVVRIDAPGTANDRDIQILRNGMSFIIPAKSILSVRAMLQAGPATIVTTVGTGSAARTQTFRFTVGQPQPPTNVVSAFVVESNRPEPRTFNEGSLNATLSTFAVGVTNSVANSGNSRLTKVTVSLSNPISSTLLLGINDNHDGSSYRILARANVQNGVATFSLNETLVPDARELDLAIISPQVSAGTATVRITGITVVAPNGQTVPGNRVNLTPAPATIQVNPVQSQLTVQLRADTNATTVGDRVIFTIDVTYHGQPTVNKVKVRFDLKNMAFQETTSVGSTIIQDGILVTDLGTWVNGQTTTFVIIGRPFQAGSVQYTATAWADGIPETNSNSVTVLAI